MSVDTQPVLAELPIADEPVRADLVDVEEVADYGRGLRDQAVVDVGGATFRLEPGAIEFV